MDIEELKKNFSRAQDTGRKGITWDMIFQEAAKNGDYKLIEWCHNIAQDTGRKGRALNEMNKFLAMNPNEKNKTNIDLQEQGLSPDAPRIFISSTINDLKDERKELKRVIEKDLKYHNYISESGGSKEKPRDSILEELGKSDICICLLGERYGEKFEIGGRKISATEDELNYAKEKGKRFFVYEKEVPKREKELEEFINKISDYKKGYLRQKFETGEELIKHVKNDIAVLFAELLRQEK